MSTYALNKLINHIFIATVNAVIYTVQKLLSVIDFVIFDKRNIERHQCRFIYGCIEMIE